MALPSLVLEGVLVGAGEPGEKDISLLWSEVGIEPAGDPWKLGNLSRLAERAGSSSLGIPMIIIRPIREEDAAAFREVLDTVCRERKYLAQLEAPPLDRVQAFVSSNVKGDYPQFVAEDDGRMVGWCDAIPGDALSGTIHVGRLGMGLLEEYRGRKLGRRLIEAAIEKATRIGLEKIELTVHASNKSAIALYRSIGFEDEGRKKDGWFVDGIYDDILLMALKL